MYISKKVVGIIAAILLAGVTALAFWVVPKMTGSPESPASDREKLQVDADAGDYVAPEETENESTGIAIPGWGSMTIPAGQTEVAVDLPNPDANEGQYYLTFELSLKETGEVLYTSGLVPPGKTIQKITLSRPLEAGSYPAVIHVQPYKMDEEQTPTNNADMETELIVVD